ncbi:MAG: hypothetical protein KTR31_16405, partial [Myxococcales bacterium]|nr:hypothetical protein [Myxococcales bacterium]
DGHPMDQLRVRWGGSEWALRGVEVGTGTHAAAGLVEVTGPDLSGESCGVRPADLLVEAPEAVGEVGEAVLDGEGQLLGVWGSGSPPAWVSLTQLAQERWFVDAVPAVGRELLELAEELRPLLDAHPALRSALVGNLGIAESPERLVDVLLERPADAVALALASVIPEAGDRAALRRVTLQVLKLAVDWRVLTRRMRQKHQSGDRCVHELPLTNRTVAELAMAGAHRRLPTFTVDDEFGAVGCIELPALLLAPAKHDPGEARRHIVNHLAEKLGVRAQNAEAKRQQVEGKLRALASLPQEIDRYMVLVDADFEGRPDGLWSVLKQAVAHEDGLPSLVLARLGGTDHIQQTLTADYMERVWKTTET